MKNAPWLQETSDLAFPIKRRSEGDRHWLSENEGALSVDVYDLPDILLVKAPIAGVRPEDLDLSLHNDMLTVRGKRTGQPEGEDHKTLHQECHWGPFSRSIILPVSVRADEASATLKDGVLSVTLPKAARHGTIPIR